MVGQLPDKKNMLAAKQDPICADLRNSKEGSTFGGAMVRPGTWWVQPELAVERLEKTLEGGLVGDESHNRYRFHRGKVTNSMDRNAGRTGTKMVTSEGLKRVRNDIWGGRGQQANEGNQWTKFFESKKKTKGKRVMLGGDSKTT